MSNIIVSTIIVAPIKKNNSQKKQQMEQLINILFLHPDSRSVYFSKKPLFFYNIL